nr:PREDICTED: junctional adhesion molecule-like [Struthio camelus australis]
MHGAVSCPPGSFHLMPSVPWQEEMVFYYYSNRSIPVGPFRDRVQWQGDISRWDGSIQLQDVQVNDSGTYVCEIRLQQWSSIFKNHTVLHVSPVAQRKGTVGAQESAVPGNTGFWSVIVGCCCVAIVLAFLAGLSLRKRSAANSALERTRGGGGRGGTRGYWRGVAWDTGLGEAQGGNPRLAERRVTVSRGLSVLVR